MYRSVRLSLATIILLSACSAEPVTWSDVVYQGAPNTPLESESSFAPAPSSLACPGSVRIARAGTVSYSTWWEARPDSSVVLMVSEEAKPGTWKPPVVADSTDHGVRGCGRPSPAITADSASGYLHLAYFAEPNSGAGVFFAHSMDRAATFHSPVAIVYGRNPARVSVASNGDRVIVAYEDPNAVQPTIAVALSNTMGHIFERRIQVSGENGRARQPVVRLGADSIRIWWSEYSSDPTVSATRPMYRAGVWHK
jgi:hypothetical protein